MKQLSAIVLALALGCTSSTETAEKNTLTRDVGQYGPKPADTRTPKVGVPRFTVEKTSLAKKDELALAAGDQLTTLAVMSERFVVVERAGLEQLLKEQGLEGVVDPEEMAQPGRVKGVDFLLIGKVTNMRVKGESASKRVNIAGIAGWSTSDARITVECGVDIRLVNPTDGTILTASFGEYKRTDSVGAIGVTIIGFGGGGSSASLEIDEDSRGLILRLALDEAMKKMVPKVDGKMRQ